MTSDPVAQLTRAAEQLSAVIAAVKPEQADLPTPCASWNVRQLIEHVMHDLDQFTVTASGGVPDYSTQTRPVSDDWYAEFTTGVTRLIAAWRRGGDLSGTIMLPGMGEAPARFPVDMQMAEFVYHAWDLARATGQRPDFDPELAQAALDWGRASMAPQFRGSEAEGKMFGPEMPVADDAPIADRLAAFGGRDPAWGK